MVCFSHGSWDFYKTICSVNEDKFNKVLLEFKFGVTWTCYMFRASDKSVHKKLLHFMNEIIK